MTSKKEDDKIDEIKFCKHDKLVKPKDLYCKTCKKAICTKCMPQHRKCEEGTSNPDEMGDEVSKLLTETLEKKQEEVKAYEKPIYVIGDSQGAIQKIISKRKETVQGVKKGMDTFYDNIIKLEDDKVGVIDKILKDQDNLCKIELEKHKTIIKKTENDIISLKQHMENSDKEYIEVFDLYEEYINKKKVVPLDLPKDLSSTEEFKKSQEKAKGYVEKGDTGCFPTRTELIEDPSLVAFWSFANDIVVHKLNYGTSERIELFDKKEPYLIQYNADVLSAEGSIYITGGTTDNKEFLGTTFRYSLLKSRGEKICDLTEPRGEHTTIYVDRKIICVGGKNKGGHLASCEELSLKPFERKSWESWKTIKLNKPKSSPSLCVFAKPQLDIVLPTAERTYTLYCFGGIAKGVIDNSIEFINLNAAESWKLLELSQNDLKDFRGTAAIQLDEKTILIFGGDSLNTTMLTIEDKKVVKTEANLPGESKYDFTGSKPLLYFKGEDNKKTVSILGNLDILEYDIQSKAWNLIHGDIWNFKH